MSTRNLAALTLLTALALPAAPLRVAIIGLNHGHISGFLNGGALVPAGAAWHRPDIQIVGFVEPDRALYDASAKRLHLTPELYFATIAEMAAKTHPDAALVFTSTYGHTAAVVECARLGIHVMMEKPLAVSYKDALVMVRAAKAHHIHVLVDYETSWYASNTAARNLLVNKEIGDLRKVIVRDGHAGPKAIHTAPEFFTWLTDPKLNGAGALYDFGCYGADLMTWMMHGEAPQSVSAVLQRYQPENYPKVDDDATVTLTYKSATALLLGSWNWPFAIKDMDVYGSTGYAKTIKGTQLEVRKAKENEGKVSEAAPLTAPNDDPLHFLAAVIHGEIPEEGSVSGLDTNVIVSEILDAARQSAQTGRTIRLPLPQ
jgi:predicted dehydrogenase